MDFQCLRCDLATPNVARISLSRGADQNPLDVSLCVELVAALGFVRETPDLRALVLTHDGPIFCSGGELVSEVDPGSRQQVGPISEVLRALRSLGKPSIAAVAGRVQGAGVGLVAACDVAVATRDSSFLVPEARVGLWSFHLLPDLVRLMGRRRATLFLLEASVIDASAAHAIGLLTRIAGEDVRAEAIAQASRYAALSPTALRMGLAALRRVDDAQSDEQLAWLQAQVDALAAAPDTREAAAAFHEHRAPQWGPK